MELKSVLTIGIVAGIATAAQQDGPVCSAVAYDFSKFTGSVSFKSVVNYDFAMAKCKMEEKTVTSPIAPLDQGLTAVFRGPIRLKQFAVYKPHLTSSTSTVNTVGHGNAHLNAHARIHRNHRLGHRACGDSLTATIDGQVVSFSDTWDCLTSLYGPFETPSASSSNSKGTGNLDTSEKDVNGPWRRVACYSASSPAESYNLTFLYPVEYSHTDFLPSSGDTDGLPAGSPQVLSDVLIPDNSRIYIASDVPAKQAAAPENKAYRGFRDDKVILVELGMPLSGLRDGSPYPDQPAFWLLNEQLPNTCDTSECSCWASGCGEFDVHEILSPGAKVGYSTLHMGQHYCGGAEDGFERAVNGTQKLAVILRAGSDGADSIVRIVQLDDGYQFQDFIGDADFQSWIRKPVGNGGEGHLLFGSACPDANDMHYRTHGR